MSGRDGSTVDPVDDALETVQADETADVATGPGQTDDTAHPPSRPARRWVLWAGVAVAVLLVALLILPVVSTLQPDYYRRYPALAGRMDAWSVSTHSKMSCADCHVDPGVGGFVSFAARSIPAFYSQLIWGPSSTNLLRPPERQACQKCHTSYRQVSPAGDLLIPHRAHVEVLGIQCVVCHKNLVHSLNRQGFNSPEMQTCTTLCHDGDKATNKCGKCHTRKNAPASHSQADWLLIHGRMATSVNCAACHSWTPDYCAACHKLRPASHVGNWKTNHATEARKRGGGCLVCHGGEKFCKRCH